MSGALVSIVVATYNVARYLPEFLGSLDAQTDGLAEVELVFVDDGSTDGSGEVIADWLAERSDVDGQVVTKPNGGPSSARNAGLAVATGRWVTFCDPDDVLAPHYLAVIREFLRSPKADDVHLVAGNLINLFDDSGARIDTHPLNFRFSRRRRVVDLEQSPTFIHLHTNTGFYRRDALGEAGLRFDERIVPNFEDAHLTALYLARHDRPRIAMLADAEYYYRRRADGSSLVQGAWGKPGKYLDVPRHGWLDLLERIAATRGRVPVWAQNLILYDLFYYLRADRAPDSPLDGIPQAWKDGLLDTLPAVLRHIEIETIADFRIKRMPVEAKRALLALKGVPAPRVAHLDRLDEEAGLVRLVYDVPAEGETPEEEITAGGRPLPASENELREVRYFGRTFYRQRTVWLHADATLGLRLGGRRVPLIVGPPRLPRYSLGPTAIRAALASAGSPGR